MKTNIYSGDEYIKNNPQYHTYDSPWKAQQILGMINKNKIESNVVCEIGCGAGEILKQLQIHMSGHERFYGYDISPQAIEICKQKENERLSFYCEDLLSKEIEPFDVLLCIDVFEHVEDYMGFLRSLRQKAKLKIFHIPLEMSVISVLRCSPIVQNRKSVGHLHYFMKETALLTLRDTGYEIVDYYYTPSGIARARGLWPNLAKLPRILFSSLNPDFTARTLGGFSLLVLAK